MLHSNINSQPEVAVSHNPAVHKKSWLTNGQAPGILQLSRVVFPPFEICDHHQHESMGEIFLVEQGTGEIEVDGRILVIYPGDCVTVLPGEIHSIRNASDTPLVLLLFGWECKAWRNSTDPENP